MEGAELRMNLKALKKIDPYIVSIEEHSSQVALYKFQSKNGEWEKTEMEGTLFVYKREAEPQYGFTIMNRLSMENLVEPVTKELDFQLQAPFLLYRNHQGDIFGIWFYEQAVCERVGQKIELLVKEAEKNNANKHKNGSGDLNSLFVKAAGKEKTPEKIKPDTSGQNLLRLLAGSKEHVAETNSSKAAEESEPITQDMKTSASVLDFFAKADQGNQVNAQMIPGSSSAFTSVPMMVGPSGDRQPVMFDAAGHHVGPRAVYTTAAVTAMPIEQGLAMGAVPVGGGLSIYPTGIPGHPQKPMAGIPGLPTGHPQKPMAGIPGLPTDQPLKPMAGIPGLPAGQPRQPMAGIPGLPTSQPRQPMAGIPGLPTSQPRQPMAGIPGLPSSQPLCGSADFNPPLTESSVNPLLARLMSNPGPPSEPVSDPALLPVFQRLMSNPGALSVDQLERQQRSSVSPVIEIEAKNAPKKTSALESDLKAKLHIGLSKPPGDGKTSGMPESSKAHVSVRTVEQVNSMALEQVTSMVPPVDPTYSYSVPTYAPVPLSAPAYAPGPNSTPAYAPGPTSAPAYAPGPSHTLLSPHVFSTRSTQSPSPARLTNGSSHKITPLTRAQMLEAVQYLLDNDDEFVTKLHEAYVRSLNSKIENF